MGVILAANGVGSALVSQIITPIIYKSTFAYRKGYLIIAGSIAVVLLLFIFLYKEGAKTTPQSKKETKSEVWEGINI